MPKITLNDSAQTSLDFLVGISIFLLVFIFVYSFIPGMFTPFNSNSDELTMTADRVAAALVEVNLSQGTADAKLPGIINNSSLKNFIIDLQDSAKSLSFRKSLGLTRNGGDDAYNLEIVIEKQGMPQEIYNNGATQGYTNVGQSKRFVIIRNPDKDKTDYLNYPGIMATITVRVW
jgi:hypothetical protein